MARYWEFDRQSVVDSLGLTVGQRVLEIGVGTGKNLAFYPETTHVTGIDLTEAMIEEAREKLDGPLRGRNITILPMDAERMTFGDSEFDAALQSFVLCVVPNPVAALKEIVRVTKPGAMVAMFDYCRSERPEIVKWQELIAPVACTTGFPAGVIVWDPLRDYEEMIRDNNLPLEIIKNDRHEDPNPFLMGCIMLLRNAK
jgi:ubiquinone/menaquinone biosynthesis C-methylase UbiE